MRIILFLSFLLFGQLVFSQNLTITIIDSESNKTIQDVKVQINENGISKNSNINGVVIFLDIHLSIITIKINHKGYNYFLESFSISNSNNLTIKLSPNEHVIDDVEIISIKGGKQSEVVTHIESKSVNELNLITRTSLIEGIGTMKGVQTTNTGIGISKPIIRGLSGSRVLTYLQGIRYENQQWGSDHGIGITELGIGRVEVIKGPASLQFGADAIGGVIFLIDEDFATFGENNFRLKSTYESVNNLYSTNFICKTTTKNVRISVGAGINSAADYQIPSGYFVKTSFYQDRYARLNLSWGKKRIFNTLKYSYQNSFIGIPGHSHDSTITLDDLISPNQLRKFRTPRQENTTHVTSWENNKYFQNSHLNTVIGWNYNKLSELEEKISIPTIQFKTHSLPYTIKLKKRLNPNYELLFGSQGMLQFNLNTKIALEKLVPNSVTFDNGLFGIITKKWKKITSQFGLRLDTRTIDISEIAFNKTFIGFNSSLGFVYFKKNKIIRLNYSSGYRAPNLFELTSDGLHHGTSRYEKGNIDLKSEFAHQVDISYEFKNDHLSFVINPFVNLINNYINLEASDSLIDNFIVYNYIQYNKALISGGEIGIHYHPHFAHFIHIESAYSFLYTTTINNQALDLIPQNRLISSLKFNIKNSTKNFKFNNLVVEHQLFQSVKRFGLYETPSNGYQSYNISLNTTYTQKENKIDLNIGVKNLLNEAFIPHTSQLKNFNLSQPGRSFYIQFIINLNSKK
jgi:iron complex outermembrane receptor protein